MTRLSEIRRRSGPNPGGRSNVIRSYRYGTRRISQTAGGTSYFAYDGMGSAANLTSSTGATQWTWSYEPFGAIRTETKANGSQPTNMMKFTGEYLDPTGLYHLRARQYDVATGRFLSRDPLSFPVTAPYVGAYTYVGDRPTFLIDPSGLRWCWKLCGVVDRVTDGEWWKHLGAAVHTTLDTLVVAGAGVAIGYGCSFAFATVVGAAVVAVPCGLGILGAGVATYYEGRIAIDEWGKVFK